jgi:cytoskeletal protein RodZ
LVLRWKGGILQNRQTGMKPATHKQMPTVAEQLRAAREARSLTVEQVADATKIRTDHLRALEDGNFNVFSAPIYIRGSVKNYAGLLKLDCASLLAALDDELGRTKKYSEPPPLSDQRKTIIDQITLVLAKLNWKMGFAGIGVILVVLIVGLSALALKHSQKSSPLRQLPPAVYRSPGGGDTLPLPRR